MSWVLLMTIYVAIGGVSGVFGGMFGIGGSSLAVPCLLYLFQYLGYPKEYVMHMAIATSLSAMVLNSAAATWFQHRRGAVHWDLFWKLVPGLVVGSVLGALVATWLSGGFLEILFGVFLLVLAVRFYFQKSPSEGSHRLPSPLILNGLSGAIGAISNLLGIGGGSMTVPLLTSFHVRVRNAIGTSSATTLVTMILGAASYTLLGWGKVHVQGAVGYIDLPAFFVVGASAACAAPLGVALTHWIDPAKIRILFVFILVALGLALIF